MLELADALEHDRDVTKIRNLHIKTRNGTVHRNELRARGPARRTPLPGSRALLQVQVPARHADEAVHLEHGLPVSLHVLPRAGHSRSVSQGHEIRIRPPQVGRARRSPKSSTSPIGIRSTTCTFPTTYSSSATAIKWLEEFAEHYAREIGIPFNCNIRYDSVNQVRRRSAREGALLRRGGRPRIRQRDDPRDRDQEALEERSHRRRRAAAAREADQGPDDEHDRAARRDAGQRARDRRAEHAAQVRLRARQYVPALPRASRSSSTRVPTATSTRTSTSTSRSRPRRTSRSRRRTRASSRISRRCSG